MIMKGTEEGERLSEGKLKNGVYGGGGLGEFIKGRG